MSLDFFSGVLLILYLAGAAVWMFFGIIIHIKLAEAAEKVSDPPSNRLVKISTFGPWRGLKFVVHLLGSLVYPPRLSFSAARRLNIHDNINRLFYGCCVNKNNFPFSFFVCLLFYGSSFCFFFFCASDLLEDGFCFMSLTASDDNEPGECFLEKWEINNNKTKFNGNCFCFGVYRVANWDEKDFVSSWPWITKISHGPNWVNYSHQLPLTSPQSTHLSQERNTFYCNLIHQFMFVCFLLFVSEANWIYSLADASERSKNGNRRSCSKNMFVVHAISDYYILFLFTWLSFFLLRCLIATE